MIKIEDLLEISERNPDILLVQSPPWDTKMPPLGIAYLSSYLKKQNYKVSVIDLNITLYHLVGDSLKYLWEQQSYDLWANEDYFRNTWYHIREITIILIERILQNVTTEYIGISINFASIKFATELIKIIKYIKPEIKLILGGWGCINEHMRSLMPGDLIDVFIVGDGEEALLETIDALRQKITMVNVPGAIFIKNNQSSCKFRPPTMNLDQIPWPTFSDFKLGAYKAILPLFTSRGCVGNCSFCNDWQYSSPYRHRSVGNVFEEIKYHVAHNNINNFSFKDLLCNGDIDWLHMLTDLIIDSRVDIKWDSQAISRKEMTYDLLCKLKKSGCSTLTYGIESFSNAVLKKMRKTFTRDIAERVLRDTCKSGIRTYVNVIVGFPGETEKDFEETFNFIKINHRYINHIGAVSVCLVNSSSELEINSQDYGLILSSSASIRAKEWISADGSNTYAVRRRRAERIIDLISELHLSYEAKTI